ncbi:unnamed protein product [Litomosoides sigmodontis]|uniref:WH2 domain-containing protein n=1 Tax=Litomosoides sigmodontis TaxID=42156 RepID=A0A3P6V4S8_LITSI|nr:unnamed protein product [Litomosoides sigmodontis]
MSEKMPLDRAERIEQHKHELISTDPQQNNLISTNYSASSSSSPPSTQQQRQNDKLLTEINKGIHLRHVIPNAHKQCISMLYDKKCEKSSTTEKDSVKEDETKLEMEKSTDIGNVLLNAMRKRRLLVEFESSSISNEDGNERRLEQWSDSDDTDSNAGKFRN